MRLSELASIHMGLVLNRKKAISKIETKQEYKVFTAKSIDPEGEVIAEELQDFRSTEVLDGHYLTQMGDVLIRLVYPNKAVHIDEENLTNIIFSSLFAVIRLKAETILPEYLTLILSSEVTKKQLYREAIGASLPVIKISSLEDLYVKDVPLEKQKILMEVHEHYKKQKKMKERLLTLEEDFYQAIIREFLKKH